MRVHVYPADRHGCGHHRLIWPAERLAALGHDVTVVEQQARRLMMVMDGDRVKDVQVPDDVDAVVFQRVTHTFLAQATRVLRAKGVAVIIDVDDDLSTIHPHNPAWIELHPRKAKQLGPDGKPHHHSWANLEAACREASLVTATTPALLRKYAPHGRGVVLPNYLADHYYGVEHTDSAIVGWPASLGSHPNDPVAVGNAIARVVNDGGRFHVTSTSPGVGKAFGLPNDEEVTQLRVAIDLLEWPQTLADQIGIGIAPLADTKFNASKSWLKPLELAAVGVPWVASPRVEYARLHQLGCGLLAEKPADWFRQLRNLRQGPALRQELSEAGRAVSETLRTRDHAWRWMEAWSGAVVADRERLRELSPV